MQSMQRCLCITCRRLCVRECHAHVFFHWDAPSLSRAPAPWVFPCTLADQIDCPNLNAQAKRQHIQAESHLHLHHMSSQQTIAMADSALADTAHKNGFRMKQSKMQAYLGATSRSLKLSLWPLAGRSLSLSLSLGRGGGSSLRSLGGGMSLSAPLSTSRPTCGALLSIQTELLILSWCLQVSR